MTAKAKELLTSREVEIIELGSKVTDEDLKECEIYLAIAAKAHAFEVRLGKV